MDKTETKYFNTSIKMYNALFELLEHKNFLDITVTELCEKASINRSTFYSHYDNMQELLTDSQNYTMNTFFNSFDKTTLLFDLPDNIDEDYKIKNYIVPYLNFIKNNKLIYKVFVENLNTFHADEYYNNLLNFALIPSLKKRGLTDVKKMNYYSKFYLTGITAIIMEWIKNNCDDDIEYITEVIMSCNKYTIF